MRLKDYQIEALDKLSSYLKIIGAERDKRATELADIEKLPAATREKVRSMLGDPVADAWKTAQAEGVAASAESWHDLRDGTGRSVPNICLKLPTGGGKTLLAAHSVDRILVNYFRQTTGFVLWIVPSEAIYTQTKAQLADRAHPIRQALDRASGGRVKILEKPDGFTRQDVEQRLCVLLLMLQSTGRRDKETLKVFQDSGQYLSFFPQDDPPARAALLKQVPNLDQLDLAEAAIGGAGASWVKQSLGNTLRVIRPIIVLDEGHRAYSEIARQTLASFNARFILELSATPDRMLSNILVNVSGRRLKDEQMIKLPIRLDVGEKVAWQITLQDAVDRLSELDQQARKLERYIRPIMLIRVDRTGKDQRDAKGGFVHSEDAFEYLTQKAGMPPEAIRRQTAEIKELKDDDLMSSSCGVRAIITKDALREGWDCPFAYVLAILSRGTAARALTQMIGRVLRQPYAEQTGIEALDQTHVFCAEIAVGDAVGRIKQGLEDEGMGDIADDIVTTKGATKRSEITVQFRKPFRGKRIMVPKVLHREGKRAFRELDYEADVLRYVDWNALTYRKVEAFQLSDYDMARRSRFALDLADTDELELQSDRVGADIAVAESLDRPALIRRMLDVIPNPWQGARILDQALANLRKRAKEQEIIASRLELVRHMKDDLQDQIEAETERIFRNKVASGEIVFKLLAAPFDNLNFEFKEIFKTHVVEGDAATPLFHTNGQSLQRALYEPAFKSNFNGFERDMALYIDDRDAVKWWWRIAARRDWGLQGWMRNKVYPDFLVQLETEGETARLLVIETKGKHLEGSADTEFKGKFFQLLEGAYTSGKDAGEIELFADAPGAMRFRLVFQEASWQAETESAIAS